VLNSVARSIIERCRGKHPMAVFIVVRDKDQEVGFFRRNFLIRNAMGEDVQEKSRESHANPRDKK
jgi:hypothetical protein